LARPSTNYGRPSLFNAFAAGIGAVRLGGALATAIPLPNNAAGEYWAGMVGLYDWHAQPPGDGYADQGGVPWLLPIPVKFGLPPLKAFRITTGHWVENLVVFPLLLLFNVWLYSANYTKFLDIVHRHIIII